MKKIVALVLALSLTATLGACADKNAKPYQAALKLYNAERYTEAKAAFQELGDYEDSAIRVQKCDYEMATAMFLKGDYLGAEAALKAMEGFKNSTELAQTCSYLLAQEAVQNGKFEEARQRLSELGSFMDSQGLLEELSQKEQLQKLQGAWSASACDLAQVVSDSLKQVQVEPVELNVEEQEPAEEAEETSEEEAGEEAKEAESSEPKVRDFSGAVTLDTAPVTIKLELLPSGAFVLELEGGLEPVLQKLHLQVRTQLMKMVEDDIAGKAGEQTIQGYLEENEIGSLDDYAAVHFGTTPDAVAKDYVDAVVQKMFPTLPIYGAYRVEAGNLVLAVGTQEMTAGIDASTGKISLTLEPLGALEFAKS